MEMYRGRIQDYDVYFLGDGASFKILSPIQKDPPDRPEEQWALRYFEVDSYEKATQKIADEFDYEGSDLEIVFENGYWTVSDPWHSGRGKTRDAALVTFYSNHLYDHEGDR